MYDPVKPAPHNAVIMLDSPTVTSSPLKSSGRGTSCWMAATSMQLPKHTTKNRPVILGTCVHKIGAKEERNGWASAWKEGGGRDELRWKYPTTD